MGMWKQTRLRVCRAITLPQNNLIGTIPNSIGSMTALTSLDLSLNPLPGTLPSSIGNCTGLVCVLYAACSGQGRCVVTAPCCSLSLWFDDRSAAFASAVLTRFLRLAYCGLTGTLPLSLSALNKLT